MTSPAQFTARASRTPADHRAAATGGAGFSAAWPCSWCSLAGCRRGRIPAVAGSARAAQRDAVCALSGRWPAWWQVAAGSAAGFRVQETVIGMSNEVGGNTNAVTGTAVLGGDRIASGSFGINLTMVTVGGKKQPQFATSLDAGRYPDATVTLARPVPLSAAFAAGQTATMTAPAELTSTP